MSTITVQLDAVAALADELRPARRRARRRAARSAARAAAALVVALDGGRRAGAPVRRGRVGARWSALLADRCAATGGRSAPPGAPTARRRPPAPPTSPRRRRLRQGPR